VVKLSEDYRFKISAWSSASGRLVSPLIGEVDGK